MYKRVLFNMTTQEKSSAKFMFTVGKVWCSRRLTRLASGSTYRHSTRKLKFAPCNAPYLTTSFLKLDRQPTTSPRLNRISPAKGRQPPLHGSGAGKSPKCGTFPLLAAPLSYRDPRGRLRRSAEPQGWLGRAWTAPKDPASDHRTPYVLGLNPQRTSATPQSQTMK